VTSPETDTAARLGRAREVVAEGAGAAPIAAILAGTYRSPGQTIAIISGRNITSQTLAQALINR
jgi:threonine dehydratase